MPLSPAPPRRRAPDFVPILSSLRRRLTACGVGTALLAAALPAQALPDWHARLMGEFAAIDRGEGSALGVYVRDLASGEDASYRAGERWYLASMVKVPVAIAVLRAVESGRLTLETPVTVRASDYVDGAGSTNHATVGAQRTVRALIDQMIIHSDNTASDMLIDLVGLKAVNEVVQSLVPEGIGRITTLGDVRRQVYGQLTPAASRLSGVELLAIHRERSDEARVRKVSQLLDVPVSRFRMPLEDAYTAYYASGVNSGRLDAYGELLALLVEGRALGRPMTDYLLQVMERTATGTRRIKAGLPPDARFAHKTGTQRRRICDAGLITTPRRSDAAPVLVVACVRGDLSLERSESALQQVGAALCRSGLLTRGVPNAPTCPAAVPAAASAAAR